MSWALNQGPSFNIVSQTPHKINGFYQRFELQQDDPRFTPGKRQPKRPNETNKGTWSLKGRKGSRKPGKQIVYSDAMPKGQPQPIYSGFSNIKNKASSRVQKKGGKLKKRWVGL